MKVKKLLATILTVALTSTVVSVPIQQLNLIEQSQEALQWDKRDFLRWRNTATRENKLGRIAKEQYSKYYELESFKNSYTYLGCYISSMVSHKFEEDLNQGTGFGL